MLSHNQIKLLSALSVKKYRQNYRKFIVEGEKMTLELLSQTEFKVESIYATENWLRRQANRTVGYAGSLIPVTEVDLKKVSSLITPQEVLAVVELPETLEAPAVPETGFHFFLDGIRDPGNMGAILRIADWFGFPTVFCSPDCVDVYSPKVIQASMGAFLRVRSRETNLDDLLKKTPNLPILGAVMQGDNLFGGGWPSGGLVVIGNEGQGIRPEVEAALTHRLTIPRPPGGGAESLNASVAAGIIAAFLVMGKK
jgi:TrmH family RNA methyltransferase